MGNASPYIGTLSAARAAGYEIFQIIDRIPTIDILSDKGDKIKDLEGNISFNAIDFSYPSRKDIQILDRLSLDIKAGSTVAFVGHSGCGKSTCIQLIQRFYDAAKGSLTIDGKDIKDLNTKWLRTQIGVVSQEPILFGTSIKENIKFGREGTTDAEVVKAAKDANAHNYIMKLPEVNKFFLIQGVFFLNSRF